MKGNATVITLISVTMILLAVGIFGYSQLPDPREIQILRNQIVRLEKEPAQLDGEKLLIELANLAKGLRVLESKVVALDSLGSGGRRLSIPTAIPTSVAEGGTGATGYTAGSLIFSDGSVLNQNNGQLFWDNTNFRLGVATVTPGVTLGVDGNLSVSGTSTVSSLFATSSARVQGLAVATNTPSEIVDIGDGTATSTVVIRGGASAGGEIILKSNDGSGCISIQAKRGAIDIGGSADLTVLLYAKVIACPN